MSFKIKINQYEGELEDIGDYKNVRGKYEYTFNPKIDPDQTARPHEIIQPHLKKYISDVNTEQKEAIYFPSKDGKKTGDIMVPEEVAGKIRNELPTVLNIDDIKSNIQNKIQEIVQLKQVLKEVNVRAEAAEAVISILLQK